jgi:hypothetical protein
MHQHNVGTTFERIANDVAGSFPETERGNRYLLIATNFFTKWPEVYTIRNQEASTMTDAPLTKFFCRFGVPRELQCPEPEC